MRMLSKVPYVYTLTPIGERIGPRDPTTPIPLEVRRSLPGLSHSVTGSGTGGWLFPLECAVLSFLEVKIRFSVDQMSLAQDAYERRWLHGVAADLCQSEPAQINLLGLQKADVEDLCGQLLSKFGALGPINRSQLMQLCLIALSLGGRFYEDPRFPEMARISSQEMPMSRRLAYFRHHARAAVNNLWLSGDAVRRLQEMKANLCDQAVLKYSKLNLPGSEFQNFCFVGNHNLEPTLLRPLEPLIPIIRPTAMVDPVHHQYKEIVRRSMTPVEVRQGAIQELERRIQLVKK